MAKIEGQCLLCGATIRRETQNPEKWMELLRGVQTSVWVICPNNHIGGVIFHKLANTNKEV